LESGLNLEKGEHMTKMSIRGISLNVEISGKGYPLVLMHGGPGLDYQTMMPLEPLADQFTLVYYDHRCNGRSEGAEVSSMTWENLTADADALREKLGFDQWAVIGHSFGGNVALEYALRYPQSLSRLVLMNTGGDQWWVNQNGPALLAKRGYSPSAVQAAHRFFYGQITPREFFRTYIKFNKAYDYHNSLLEIIQLILLGHMPKFRPEALIFGYSQLLKDWNIMDRLNEIKVPTLILAGRYDFLFPTEHQITLAAGIPNAHLEIIECAGHNPHMEQPEAVLRLIRDFLAAPNSGSNLSSIKNSEK
jgi:pimeloyl-ACP methyl ester carboxylesterase